MAVKFVASSPKRAPSSGATYRFVGVPASKHGNISLLIGRRVWSNNHADKARLAMNNVFATITEARDARRAITKALGLVVKRA